MEKDIFLQNLPLGKNLFLLDNSGLDFIIIYKDSVNEPRLVLSRSFNNCYWIIKTILDQVFSSWNCWVLAINVGNVVHHRISQQLSRRGFSVCGVFQLRFLFCWLSPFSEFFLQNILGSFADWGKHPNVSALTSKFLVAASATVLSKFVAFCYYNFTQLRNNPPQL